MNIRQAGFSDSLLLSLLCMDVQRLHAENHPDIFKMPQNDDFALSFFEEVLANPMTKIFIAEENGDAIGYIFCQLIERPETSFAYAWIHGISIPAHIHSSKTWDFRNSTIASGEIYRKTKAHEGLFLWARQGSNLRPLLCQSSALTN